MDTELEILEQLFGLMHEMRSEMRARLQAGEHDLSIMHFRALMFFSQNPGASANDLAQRSRRDKAQITRLIKELESKHLLAREQSPDDKRCYQLSLLPEGEKVCDFFRAQQKTLAGNLVAGFSEQQLVQLESGLVQMRENLQLAAQAKT